MGLQEFWFIAIAVLFLGYFVLEGFDFGVGMLMPITSPITTYHFHIDLFIIISFPMLGTMVLCAQRSPLQRSQCILLFWCQCRYL